MNSVDQELDRDGLPGLWCLGLCWEDSVAGSDLSPEDESHTATSLLWHPAVDAGLQQGS